MMKFKPKSAWWKLTPLMVCLLAACSDDGEDGQPGKPGEVVVNISNASSLQAEIENVAIDEQTNVSVDFYLSNANGVAVSGLDELDEVNTLGFGIAKLGSAQAMKSTSGTAAETNDLTNPLQWTSYINNLVAPSTGATEQASEQWQATIESSCKLDCVESLGGGHYRYTFSQALNEYSTFDGLDTTYESDKTHRVYLELKPASDSPLNTMLVNTVYDFVPATGQAAEADESRVLIDQEQACYRCHSSDNESSEALLLHGSKRFAFEGCVMCHNSYSGDPETGAPLDMATLTHQIHKGDYMMVGRNGKEYDFSEVTYPGNMKECQACHIADATPQADQYFIPSSNGCLSCHAKYAPEDWNGTAVGLFHNRDQFPLAWEQSCAGCHPDSSNPQGAGKFHLALKNTQQQLKQEYAFAVSSAAVTADQLTVNLEFALQGRFPADDPAIDSLWLVASGDPEITDRPANNGQRKLWNLAAPGSDVALSMQGHTLTATVSSLTVADFGDLDSSKVQAKLVLCADSTTGFAASCESTTTRVEVISSSPLTLNGDTVTRKPIADEALCQGCHDSEMQQRIVSAHSTHQNDAPDSRCGTCHAPLGATALTDNSCNDCHNNEMSMYLGATAKHTPGPDSLQPYRTLNNSLTYRELVHSLHSGTRTVQFRGAEIEEPVTYPKAANDCSACHVKGQLTLENLSNGVSIITATPGATEKGQVAEYSPTVAACGACHTDIESWANHAISSGGVYNADATGGRTYQSGGESCAVCHSEGSDLGVDAVHGYK